MKPANPVPVEYSVEQFFYGSVTVGERGQVVIPAKARRDYGIETGDQLLIVGHPTKSGLMIAKVEAIQAFMTKILGDLRFIESVKAMTPVEDTVDDESASSAELEVKA
jgi:AbrB family looped-hinge helix DNA binding protein